MPVGPSKRGASLPPSEAAFCQATWRLGLSLQSEAWTDATTQDASARATGSVGPAHLSETVPIPDNNSLIFCPVLATVASAGHGSSELRSRLHISRRPRADSAKSLAPPGDAQPWGPVNRRGGGRGANGWRHRTGVIGRPAAR